MAFAHLFAAVAGGRGYWFDEMYMLAVGRNHLDWGRPTSRRSRR
ncbi:hypothetical protein [Rhodococcus pyridinivorans]